MSPNIAMFAPIIRTERLTLRRYNPETDNQFLIDLLNSSWSQMPTDPVWEMKDLLRLYRNITLSPQNCLGLTPPGPVSYIVHLGDENGELIGNVGLAERHPDIAPDIGYALMPSHRQKGYATEAALALKDYMISFGFKEMMGFCLPTNEPSNAILRKLGFERGGEALVNGKVIANAYVLPGMKHCTVEKTQFNRMGVDK